MEDTTVEEAVVAAVEDALAETLAALSLPADEAPVEEAFEGAVDAVEDAVEEEDEDEVGEETLEGSDDEAVALSAEPPGKLHTLLAEAAAVTREHSAGWSAGTWAAQAASSELNAAFDHLLKRLTPSVDDDRQRFELFSLLSRLVSGRFSGVLVAVFGSQVSAFNSRSSDLDVALLPQPGSKFQAPPNAGESEQHALKKRLLSALRRELERERAVTHIQFIPQARVPIVKLTSSCGVQCDVSVNSDGVFKSAVLGCLADMQPLYRALVRLVKAWARAQNLNDPSAGTLNSFALSMFALFHCQACLPQPLLPPLAALLARQPEDALVEERQRCADGAASPGPHRRQADSDRDLEGVRVRCAALRGFGDDAARGLTLPTLCASFFAHWAAALPALAAGACPRPFSAAWGAPGAWGAAKRFALAVEDPFDVQQNPARSLFQDQAHSGRLFAAVRDAAEALRGVGAGGAPTGAALRALGLRVFADEHAFDTQLWTDIRTPVGLQPALGTPAFRGMCGRGGRGGRGRRAEQRAGRGGGRSPAPPPSPPSPMLPAFLQQHAMADAQSPGSDCTPRRTLNSIPRPRLPPSPLAMDSPVPYSPASGTPRPRHGGQVRPHNRPRRTLEGDSSSPLLPNLPLSLS